jgi:hypothetical protein
LTSCLAQFDAAGLDVWNNRWSEVHDFTPQAGNWKCLRQVWLFLIVDGLMVAKGLGAADMLRSLPEEVMLRVGASFNTLPVGEEKASVEEKDASTATANLPDYVAVVPQTFGVARNKPSSEVLF